MYSVRLTGIAQPRVRLCELQELGGVGLAAARVLAHELQDLHLRAEALDDDVARCGRLASSVRARLRRWFACGAG